MTLSSSIAEVDLLKFVQMDHKYAYITGCLILFLIWLFIFLRRKDLRKEMILASFWGMPFGFIDYFLVPQYWHPSSLFGLMERYGVGIESFLFLFLMAGIASVTYEFFYNEKLVRLTHTGHRHYWLLYSVPVAFVVMSALFPTIAIYNMMIVGGIGAAITACNNWPGSTETASGAFGKFFTAPALPFVQDNQPKCRPA